MTLEEQKQGTALLSKIDALTARISAVDQQAIQIGGMYSLSCLSDGAIKRIRNAVRIELEMQRAIYQAEFEKL